MSTEIPISVLLVACTQRNEEMPPRLSTAAAKPPIDTSRRKRKASRRFDFPAALGPTKNAREESSTSAFLKFRQFCNRMLVKRMFVPMEARPRPLRRDATLVYHIRNTPNRISGIGAFSAAD